MTSYKHILVAIDFAESAEQVMKRALELRRIFNSRISLIHVVEPVMVDFANDVFMPGDLETDRKLVEVATQRLEMFGVHYQLEKGDGFIRQGNVRQEVLRFASEEGADLVVVGSHGKSGVQLLLGSTANALLHGAGCDVLAVRIRD